MLHPLLQQHFTSSSTDKMDIKVDNNENDDFGNIDLADGNTNKNAASFIQNLLQNGDQKKYLADGNRKMNAASFIQNLLQEQKK